MSLWGLVEWESGLRPAGSHGGKVIITGTWGQTEVGDTAVYLWSAVRANDHGGTVAAITLGLVLTCFWCPL